MRDSASVRVRAPEDLPRVRWRTVSVGLTYVCALTVEGKPYCWGTNTFDELGTGSRRQFVKFLSPTPVQGAPLFETIRVVGIHSACGLTAAGEAWCWGYRSTTATGDVRERDDISHRTPKRIRFSDTVRDITGGLVHGCLLNEEGRAYCWGSNLKGELGTGNWDESYVPALVDTEDRFLRLDLVGPH
jgi:alpha-tubulin suppressor-like RCC1 family protein